MRSYLRWVSQNRELAGYLLTMRRAEFMSEVEVELERMNAVEINSTFYRIQPLSNAENDL